jgi:hypothetical protein
LQAQQTRLTITAPAQITAKPGTSVNAAIRVEVQPGFHVNSNHPHDEFLIPLKLTWTSGPLQTEAVQYPKAEDIRVGNETLSVFTGMFEIQTQFRVPANTPPGMVTMTGKIRYQACNNQMCFRPSSADVRLPIAIE